MTPQLTQLYDDPLEDASALAREMLLGGDQRTALARQLSGLVEDARACSALTVASSGARAWRQDVSG